MIIPNEGTITVMIFSDEKKRAFVPQNDYQNNIWFSLDLEAAAERLCITVKDFLFTTGKF